MNLNREVVYPPALRMPCLVRCQNPNKCWYVYSLMLITVALGFTFSTPTSIEN